jgi:hypothetical protein
MADEMDAVRAGMEAFQRMQMERDQAQTTAAAWERAHGLTEAENHMMRERIKQLEYQSQWYMRYATELRTQLAGIQTVINAAMQAAKDNAFRPTNAAPSLQQPELPGEGARLRAVAQALEQQQPAAAEATEESMNASADDGAPVPQFLKQPPEQGR